MFKSDPRRTQRRIVRFALAWSALSTVIGAAAALSDSAVLFAAFMITSAPTYVAMFGGMLVAGTILEVAPLPEAVSVWITVAWPLDLLLSLAVTAYAQGLAMGAAETWLARLRRPSP